MVAVSSGGNRFSDAATPWAEADEVRPLMGELQFELLMVVQKADRGLFIDAVLALHTEVVNITSDHWSRKTKEMLDPFFYCR